MTNLIDPSGNYTGYEIEHEDRDLIVAGSAPMPDLTYGAPEEVDYGVGFAIRNQSNRPSCAGHSLAAVARMGARLAAGGPIDLDEDGKGGEAIEDDFSPLWCWVRRQIHGGTVGARRGATMGGGIKVGLEDGFAREVRWPYSQNHTTRIPSDVAEDAKQFKFGRYSKLREEPKVHEWLGSGQGPIEWGKGWPLSWTGGCLADSGSSGRGGHATAIRGYWAGAHVARMVPAIASKVRNEPYVYVCENSHSERAQWKGLYFVSRRGMESMLRNRSTECLGWSDMKTPLVRKVDWAKVRWV